MGSDEEEARSLSTVATHPFTRQATIGVHALGSTSSSLQSHRRSIRRRASESASTRTAAPHPSPPPARPFYNSSMVRLITQNLLSCPSRACAYPTNFPLSFRNVERLEMVDAEFNEEFMRGVLSRIEWNALRKSAAEVSFLPSSPSEWSRRGQNRQRGSPVPTAGASPPDGTGRTSFRCIVKTRRSHDCRRKRVGLERSMDAEEGDSCRNPQALAPGVDDSNRRVVCGPPADRETSVRSSATPTSRRNRPI